MALVVSGRYGARTRKHLLRLRGAEQAAYLAKAATLPRSCCANSSVLCQLYSRRHPALSLGPKKRRIMLLRNSKQQRGGTNRDQAHSRTVDGWASEKSLKARPTVSIWMSSTIVACGRVTSTAWCDLMLTVVLHWPYMHYDAVAICYSTGH